MIPPAFDYHVPKSLPEALGLLSSLEDAKILAGGHSLLPVMKLRLAQPANLIDLNRVPELRGIREAGGRIRIGAMTVENDLLDSALLAAKVPLLPEVVRQIADPQVRNRGTIGGDIAHGDPANDHPAVAIALDATLVLAGPAREREVKAASFYHGIYTTELGADEILKEIVVDPFPAGTGYAYCKLKRKTGDWATAAAAVVLRLANGAVSHVRIALTNVGPTPIHATAAENALRHRGPTASGIEAAAEAAMAACDPSDDLRGDRDYKIAMAGEMTRRALRLAFQRAGARVS
jgi:carbon-monoxide dehydrogenase medium subunit